MSHAQISAEKVLEAADAVIAHIKDVRASKLAKLRFDAEEEYRNAPWFAFWIDGEGKPDWTDEYCAEIWAHDDLRRAERLKVLAENCEPYTLINITTEDARVLWG